MTGWFKIHRAVLDHPMFDGRADKLGAWVMLIAKANHVDGGTLARGEYRASIKRLAQMFGWTDKRVRNFMAELVENGMVTWDTEGAKKGTKGALISICNYSKYQSIEVDADTKGAQKGQHSKNKKEEEDSTPDGVLVAAEADDTDLLGNPTKPTKPKTQPIMEAFEAYNATAERCGLPQARMTPQRRKAIGARLREHGIDGWHKMLANVERSSFLTGQTSSFRANLGFLLQPEKFTRALEGSYGNGRHTDRQALTGLIGSEPTVAAPLQPVHDEF